MTPVATLADQAIADPSSNVRVSDSPYRSDEIHVVITVEDGHDAPWWAQPVEQRLEQLMNLEPNWNSHGARPPRPESVFLAVRVIASLLRLDDARPLPHIVPTWQGGLQLEWHLQTADIEITVNPRDAVWAFITTANASDDGPLTEMEGKVNGILSQVVN